MHCPVVMRLHGSDTYFCYLDSRSVKWINKFHEKKALIKANGHLSVSKYTADVTNQLFHINKKFTIIPNGINTNSFNTDYTFNDAKTILYFGGIIRKKGVLEIPHFFNQVIKKIPDAQLILIGQDMSDKLTRNASTFQMMQQLFSEEAGLNVKFLGSVPYQEIKQHIENATLCIFPSYAEALPVSWIEAMAMGKPVVASNVGWAKEVIDDGIDGFLVHPSQHSEYANKIIQLLQNEGLQKELGIKARKKIEQKFSMSILAEQSLLFYKSLIN